MKNRQATFALLILAGLGLLGMALAAAVWRDRSQNAVPSSATAVSGSTPVSSESRGDSSPTAPPTSTPRPVRFDGERAYADVVAQVSFGARVPGSAAHGQAVDWITATLEEAAWETTVEEASMLDNPIRNIVAKWGSGRPWIILGAHYDSRLYADQDPDPAKQSQPVPGANDGASGVAVLLEIARVLPGYLSEHTGKASLPAGQVWLVFLDAEDNGNIAGWDWILGSRAFVNGLEEKPDAAVIIDMIGDADLQIYYERNSDAALMEAIWKQAAELGYGDRFIAEPKFQITDDHVHFLQAGIPAADLIDFDYPYWHTTADTPDKVSAGSLRAVGDTLLAWLANGSPGITER